MIRALNIRQRHEERQVLLFHYDALTETFVATWWNPIAYEDEIRSDDELVVDGTP